MKSRWFVGLGGFCLAATTGLSDPPPTVQYLPPPGSKAPCPPPLMPGMPGMPVMPGVPSATPTPPSTPSANTPQAPATPPATPAPSDTPTPSDPSSAAPERGAESYASYTPSMFGDAFGGSTGQLTIRIPQKIPIATPTGSFFFTGPNGDNTRFNISTSNGATIFTPPLETRSFGVLITQPFVADGGLIKNRVGEDVYKLFPQAQDQLAHQQEVIRRINLPAGNLDKLPANARAVYNSDPNLSAAIPVTGGVVIATQYDALYFVDQQTTASTPSPTTGGFIGRTKLAEDNSPLPRDRIIFNYDYFSNVPLNAAGTNVNRFSPGFEFTFFDQDASLEVRLPFAASLNSNILSDGSTTSTTAAIGNLNLTLKALLYGDDTVNIAAGLGLGIPTANDTRVFTPDLVEVVRLENDTYILTPYIALLYTPDSNFFLQTWAAIGFNVVGNPVLSNPDLNGLVAVGRLTDQHLLQVDAQVGYWVVHPMRSDGWLRGLAPFAEIHWNSALGGAQFVQAENFTLGPANANFNELNLSFGAVVQVGDAVNLALGAAFPTLNDANRTFDYQLGVRCSVFFGPTLRNRTTAATITGL